MWERTYTCQLSHSAVHCIPGIYFKNETSLRDHWNNIKYRHSHYRSTRERRKKGVENLFDGIMAENVQT